MTLQKHTLIRCVTTGGYSGLARKCPGTVGSVAACLAWSVLYPLVREPNFLLLLVTAGGWWCVREDLKARHISVEDPQEIVIDEWAGLFLTYWLAVPLSSWHLILGFVLFRVFDITKPGPIRKAESLGGAEGIMADDLLAGCAAGIVAIVIRFVTG